MKKIQNIVLVLRCLLFLPFRGRAMRRIIPPRRVLVYQSTPNVGDMVCITPIFRELKRVYPDCTLIVMGKRKPGEVIAGNPHIDQYIITPDATKVLIRTIRDLHVDYAVATSPSTRGLAALFLAGIPGIATLSSTIRSSIFPRTYLVLKRLVIQISFLTFGYVPRNYLKLLKPIGIGSQNLRLELYYSPEAQRACDALLERSGVQETGFIVAIAPGGSSDIRWWPQDRYAALADHLHERYGATIFLIGAGSDVRPIDDVIRSLKPSTPRVNLLNQSLDEFKAFISRAGLVLGNDSGPMVTAEAFDVPTVVFIGPTDEREHHPPSEGRHRTIVAPDRGVPVTNALNWDDYDPQEAYRQIRAISLEQAKHELDGLLAFLGKN